MGKQVQVQKKATKQTSKDKRGNSDNTDAPTTNQAIARKWFQGEGNGQ
jgi:hypothetical protein